MQAYYIETTGIHKSPSIMLIVIFT